jgi:hypothetical protein
VWCQQSTNTNTIQDDYTCGASSLS